MDILTRYAALISYDGSAFHGFQRQRGLPTVQEALEDALSLLNKGMVRVTGAGRTDRGVHALGQVVSFDMFWPHGPDALRKALEANLPSSIGVFEVVPVDEGFDARKSALWRKYAYFIWKGDCRLPHLDEHLWRNGKPWDMQKARAFLSMIKGHHDFSAFCRKADLPDNAWRTIIDAKLENIGHMIKVTIIGRSFLTNMVRIIIGTMDEVAAGRRSLPAVELLLKSGSREEAGPTVPANALFLWEVKYDPSPWTKGGYPLCWDWI